MNTPKITFLLCTVRSDHGYKDRPELHTLGTVIDDLKAQTFQDFELLIIDGLWGKREGLRVSNALPTNLKQGIFWDTPFDVFWAPPRENLWTEHKKVAICAYRNTGLIYARGELIVNLDDCCRLPPIYAETFWLAYRRGFCAAMTWPKLNDHRRPGVVTGPGQVYGFGSYPLEAALDLNGYDEAYDGAQGLEDCDWSTRLFNHGVKQVLLDMEGFDILPQTGHDPRAIDLARPLERCCNQSWQTQRVWRNVQRANTPELWTPEALARLVGPCQYRFENTPAGKVVCKHHLLECPYVDRGFVFERTEFHEAFMREPPVVDLREERRKEGL